MFCAVKKTRRAPFYSSVHPTDRQIGFFLEFCLSRGVAVSARRWSQFSADTTLPANAFAILSVECTELVLRNSREILWLQSSTCTTEKPSVIVLTFKPPLTIDQSSANSKEVLIVWKPEIPIFPRWGNSAKFNRSKLARDRAIFFEFRLLRKMFVLATTVGYSQESMRLLLLDEASNVLPQITELSAATPRNLLDRCPF